MGKIRVARDLYSKLSYSVDFLFKWICYFLIVLLILILALSTFLRYCFQITIPFVEELSRFAFIWMGLFGSCLVLRRKLHPSVSLLVDRLPPSLQNGCYLMNYLLICSFLCVLFSDSLNFIMIAGKNQFSAALKLELFWVYLSLPIVVIAMIIQSFELVLTHIDLIWQDYKERKNPSQ